MTDLNEEYEKLKKKQNTFDPFVIVYIVSTLLIIGLNIWIYGFVSCDSWLMKAMPQREIPGRCLVNVK